MAEYSERTWIAEASSGLPRAERRSCTYRPYLPDLLAPRTIRLDGALAADIADAEAAVIQLDARTKALSNTEALARLLLRAESVASSRIEGLEIGPRRLMRAEAARLTGADVGDVGAEEVLGNIDAMNSALELAELGDPITIETICEIHRRLLAGTRLAGHAGMIRDAQNWIGGNIYNPCSATYVPPPPEEVPALLSDLCEFCNSDMLPTIAQAALVHAQFETIHPFADGNGRTGRALIHLIMRRRGLTVRVQPPVSLVLATHANRYIAGLERYRHVGPSDSEAAHDGLNDWLGMFASACLRAVQDADAFEHRCQEIQLAWRDRLGRVREGSSTDLLIRSLPGTPILSVKSTTLLLGRSKPQVNDAISRLTDAGILTQVTVGRRNRAFEAREIIDAFASLERQLASEAGDTIVSPPVRPVPVLRKSPGAGV